MNCKQSGLLFQPPLALTQEKKSSKWSCEHLYGKNKRNGLTLENKSFAKN